MEVVGFEPTSEGLRYTPLSHVETKSPPSNIIAPLSTVSSTSLNPCVVNT